MAEHSPEGKFGFDTPLFNVDAVQWRRIEKAYGSSLPPGVRAAIVRATDAYIFLQSFEQTSEGLAKAKVILEAHDKAATRFFNELFAGSSAISDAGVYAHYLIESNFKTSELKGQARGLDVFLNLLRAFHVACNASIKQLNDPSSPWCVDTALVARVGAPCRVRATSLMALASFKTLGARSKKRENRKGFFVQSTKTNEPEIQRPADRRVARTGLRPRGNRERP